MVKIIGKKKNILNVPAIAVVLVVGTVFDPQLSVAASFTNRSFVDSHVWQHRLRRDALDSVRREPKFGSKWGAAGRYLTGLRYRCWPALRRGV